MPGTSPAQARPSHTGQTRQNPLSCSRAVARMVFLSIRFSLPSRVRRADGGRPDSEGAD
jgi:hypothetical protein